MNTIRYEHDTTTNIVTLTFDDPASAVNTISEAWLADLTEALDRLYADKAGIAGVIMASAKDTFFAGADLKALLQQWPAKPESIFDGAQSIKRQLRRLETLGRPVVACIAGS